MARDPVCGMDIEPADAAGTSAYKGETIYFCALQCKERFDADPDGFMTGSHERPESSVASESGEIHTCPMHPEVEQVGPGSCPKCGMALDPVTPAIPLARTDWICPMHPEIVRDVPGSCPICGMALEPRTVLPEEEKNPELIDMTRRFFASLILTTPLFMMT